MTNTYVFSCNQGTTKYCFVQYTNCHRFRILLYKDIYGINSVRKGYNTVKKSKYK